MNAIGVIILTALLADFLIHLLADILNLRSVRTELPEAFGSVYDPDRYRQSQAYLRVNTRFGWVASGVGLLLILGFWFARGFPVLDRWVRSWELSPVLTGVLFIGILMALKATVSLPFSLYATFVIEERFGFNRTTWKTFLLDRIKGLALSIVLGVPLIAGILWFFQYSGPSGWWLSWLAVVLFMLVIQYVAPTWILPLFNRFDPLEPGELREAILAYANRIRFPLDNIFVMDGSKRSGKGNAFFTGFGKRKRIVLFDTLVSQHTVPELLAVLAHEMGHYQKKHVLQSLILGVLQTGVMFFLLSFFLSYRGLFDAFYMEHVSVYAGLVFFGMLYAPIDFFTGLILLMRSRKNEYTADRFAVSTTGNAQAMADALKKLSVSNLSNLHPHRLYVALNYSHPPVLERIRAIQEGAGANG